jgi:hypothetical protein
LFTKVEATNSQGSLLTLQLGDTSSGINIQNITGLDPVKATIVSSSFANQDGAVYQSSRRDTRNIVITLELDPDPNITDVLSVRRYVYSQFVPKDYISLKFYVDDTDDTSEDGYLIYGYVESCSSPMFVQDNIVTISVINTDPDFIDPVPKVTSGMTSADTTATHFPNSGTVSSGYVMTMNFNAAVSEFTIYYTDANLVNWSMDITYAFEVGDSLEISTMPGNKYATLTRAGVGSSILYAVSPQSVWSQLAPGDNWLRIYLSGDTSPGDITGSVTYTSRFGAL